LLKNTKLLFMVSHFNRRRVISGLPIIAGQPNISNLSKQSESFLMKFLLKLEAEGFDGWFSSIENKGYTEVALLNQNTIFKVVKTEELKRKWRNSNNLNSVLLKDWGTKYPIGRDIILYLPSSYQKKIRDYKECSAQSKTPYDFVFEMIVRDSMIYYF